MAPPSIQPQHKDVAAAVPSAAFVVLVFGLTAAWLVLGFALGWRLWLRSLDANSNLTAVSWSLIGCATLSLLLLVLCECRRRISSHRYNVRSLPAWGKKGGGGAPQRGHAHNGDTETDKEDE